jgi:hypothetical protein
VPLRLTGRSEINRTFRERRYATFCAVTRNSLRLIVCIRSSCHVVELSAADSEFNSESGIGGNPRGFPPPTPPGIRVRTTAIRLVRLVQQVREEVAELQGRAGPLA